jgi:CarD family transcriptional regulator
MNYKIGDTIVHWAHGVGKVVAIDQKDIAGVAQEYYVVDVAQFKLWVPVDDANEGSIRLPTDSVQFIKLFDILRIPGNPLPDNQYLRKLELSKRMQKRTLVDVCHVIRDLKDRSRLHSLNQNDSSLFMRAEEYLLNEWVISMGVALSVAHHELDALLDGNLSEPVEP